MGEWNIFSDMPKYKNMQVQQLEHWYSKCNAKEIYLSTWNGQAN